MAGRSDPGPHATWLPRCPVVETVVEDMWPEGVSGERVLEGVADPLALSGMLALDAFEQCAAECEVIGEPGGVIDHMRFVEQDFECTCGATGEAVVWEP